MGSAGSNALIGARMRAPIDGCSRQFSNELPEAVVDAFHRMNVPASTNGLLNNAYLLEGRAFLRNGQALVFWQLTNRRRMRPGSL